MSRRLSPGFVMYEQRSKESRSCDVTYRLFERRDFDSSVTQLPGACIVLLNLKYDVRDVSLQKM
jgi:hypothetical protein